jgi:hypothetical protein
MKIKIFSLLLFYLCLSWCGCKKNEKCINEKFHSLIESNKVIYSDDLSGEFNLFNNVLIENNFCINQKSNDFQFIGTNYFHITDEVLYRYFVLIHPDGRSLKGFWGLSSNGAIYFLSVDLIDCPPFLIVDLCSDNISYSSKDFILSQKCFVYDNGYSYKIQVTLEGNDINLRHFMDPLVGTTVKENIHNENASYAELNISLTNGVLSLEYNPNIEYVILPWLYDFVFSEKEL